MAARSGPATESVFLVHTGLKAAVLSLPKMKPLTETSNHCAFKATNHPGLRSFCFSPSQSVQEKKPNPCHLESLVSEVDCRVIRVLSVMLHAAVVLGGE